MLGPVSTPAPQESSPTSVPPAASAAPTIQTVESPSPAPSSTPSFAPVCATDPLIAACAPPSAQTLDRFCVEKIPYTLVAMPIGTTFEPVDPLLICKDEGIRGGSQVISCHSSQELYTFDLVVCNSACSVSSLQVDGNQCANGFGFSETGQCCWPIPGDDEGCALVHVEIGACAP